MTEITLSQESLKNIRDIIREEVSMLINDRYITAKEAYARLGISPKTFSKLRNGGVIKALQEGNGKAKYLLPDILNLKKTY